MLLSLVNIEGIVLAHFSVLFKAAVQNVSRLASFVFSSLNLLMIPSGQMHINFLCWVFTIIKILFLYSSSFRFYKKRIDALVWMIFDHTSYIDAFKKSCWTNFNGYVLFAHRRHGVEKIFVLLQQLFLTAVGWKYKLSLVPLLTENRSFHFRSRSKTFNSKCNHKRMSYSSLRNLIAANVNTDINNRMRVTLAG